MRKAHYVLLTLSLVMFVTTRGYGQVGPYRLRQTFHVGGTGGWDYLTIDPAHGLLYVPRTTHTMVLDAATGKTVADIPGQQRNHGVAIASNVGRGFISDGEDGSVTIFDLKTYQVLGKVKAEKDADCIIYDPSSRKVLVSCGDAGTLISIVQTVETRPGARTMGIDPKTHTIYLPTAEFGKQKDAKGRLIPNPGSFMILVVGPSNK